MNSICALDQRFSLNYLPAQALECSLAHIALSEENQGYLPDALDYIKEFVQEKKLSCRFVSMGKPRQVLIFDKNSSVSLNQSLVEKGFAFVDKVTRKRFIMDHALKLKSGSLAKDISNEVKNDLSCILESQELAKKSHLNIWRYGDFEDDDD